MDAGGGSSDIRGENFGSSNRGGIVRGQPTNPANTIREPIECQQCRKTLPLVKRWGDCRRSGYCSKECSAFPPAALVQNSRHNANTSPLPFASLRIASRSAAPTRASAEDSAVLPAPPPHIPKTKTARQPRAQPIKSLKDLCIARLVEHASLLADISGIGETLGVRRKVEKKKKSWKIEENMKCD